MAQLVLVTANDPDAILRAAAAPFCRPGMNASLPLLAVRQGGLRDAVHELAAISGATGWLGKPILVFSELASLFAPERAPLDALERHAILEAILASRKFGALGGRSARRSIVDSLDRLIGDLIADGVEAPAFESALAQTSTDTWTTARNEDLVSIYGAYRSAIATLAHTRGLPRCDGRDDLLVAAEAICAAGSDLPMLRRPFDESPQVPRSVDIVGLADLRRGWRPFLTALKGSPAVHELRVYTLDGFKGEDPSEVRQWALDNGAEVRPIERERRVAPAIAVLQAELLTDTLTQCAPSAALTVMAAPDSTREIESAARRIKSMLVIGNDAGMPVAPRDIAVIARVARPYLTQAADVFERYGIPTYARLRHNVAEVPAIAALLGLFRAIDEGWTVSAFRRVSDSPYFSSSLDIGLLIEAAGRTNPRDFNSWKKQFGLLAAEGDDDDPERAVRRRDRIARTLQQLGTIEPLTAGKAEPRHLRDWIDVTLEMIGGVDAGMVGFLEFAANVYRQCDDETPRILLDAARVDAAAVRSMAELLVAWRNAAPLGPTQQPMSAAAWADELQRALADQSVSVRTGERGGVQLSEATAAEGQSWPNVFVIGMSVGNFPAEAARDLLFGSAEREMLRNAGLPTEPSDIWQSREAALFRSIVGAASDSLHLSYAYADHDGSQQLRSAFLDDIVARLDGGESCITTIPGSWIAPEAGEVVWSADEALRVAALTTRDPMGGDTALGLLAAASSGKSMPRTIEQLLHAAAIERQRVSMRNPPLPESRLDSAHAYNGRIDDSALLTHLSREFGDRIWSATQLESYGRCGFAFFGKHVLRANELEEQADEETSAREYGSIVHDALAETYRKLLAYDASDPMTGANVEYARKVVAQAVADAFERAGLFGTNGLFAARMRETTITLQEYVVWEIEQNDKSNDRTRPAHVELSFGLPDSDRPAVALGAEGKTIKLRGRIDRVDELIPEVAAGYLAVVDHKTGGSALQPVGGLRKAGASLQLELYLAALDQIMPGAKTWGGAYQIIKDHKRVAPLERCSIDSKGRLKVVGTKTQAAHDDAIRDSARMALSLVDGVLSGRFAARVPDGTHCLNYCAMRTACREEHMAVRP